ncbi:MAG: magnesium transporter [Chthoniobacter sp.]|nr:magnesium transporter [Chthoniobacter sp.]
MNETTTQPNAAAPAPASLQELHLVAVEKAPAEIAQLLEPYPPEFAAALLELLNQSVAQEVLAAFHSDRRQKVIAAAAPELRHQWMRNEAYEENAIGRMMEPPLGVYGPETTIAEAVADLRQLAKRAFITYLWVVDESERLLGVVVMREMLLSENSSQRLDEVMIPKPFFLTPEMSLTEAMKATVIRHFPVYPVCDAHGRLIGLLRGTTLFEAQAIELSAQPGTMVGVEREERLSTPWSRCLKFRHPWLQLNLLTAFIAAAVVGIFEHTIDRIVVLAVFLPVLAGQSGNTGCQALAVALRGITLGELTPGKARALVAKEALLGLCNGALVGVTAAIGMFVFATIQKNPAALMLGVIVFLAMVGSCVVSGVFGALVPLTLKKLGADPATASSIFLTTATDVVSMGTFLGLATWLI